MCSFVDSIFFVGGYYNRNNDIRRSCVVFNTISEKCKEVAKMNDNRIHAACTVFEGRVVISGGYTDNEDYYDVLRTVEAYDHVADKWSYMPSMVNESVEHDLIAISNKLFAIGCGQNHDICEVYDTFSKKFVVFKSHPTFFNGFYHKSITFGRRIIVFNIYSTKVAIYDVDKNEWSEESFEVKIFNRNSNYLKIPSLKF